MSSAFEQVGQALDATAPPRPVPELEWDAKSRLVLPETPAPEDVAGQCAWLTAVFALDARHPITGGERQGLAGPDGHAELRRASAQSIRLEPIRVVNQPPRLVEAVSGWGLPTDSAVPALKSEHCRQIALVVRMLIGATASITVAQEAEAIVGTFLQAALAVEARTTYGTPGQRYEAAEALQGAHGELRYLLDANTGELVIRVSDLGEAARRHVGGSLPRGWVDARMAALRWARITLDGHALSGRAGRNGPHARCAAYRGHLGGVAAAQSPPEPPAVAEVIVDFSPNGAARCESCSSPLETFAGRLEPCAKCSSSRVAA